MERDGWEITVGGVEKKKVFLADEEYVTLFVGNLKFTRMFASPKNLSELAVGFLVTEGVADYEDVKSVKSEGANAFVELKSKGNLDVASELRSSGCVGMTTDEPAPLETKISFDRKTVVDSLRHLNENSPTWRKTGGTHTACIISGRGEPVCSFEDIGRHNALDKCVGWALLNDVSLDDKFLLFTGRVSAGIVYKAVRAKIPLIVSNTAALSKAVEAADKLNLSTAGFARGEKLTAYT
ncbi:MAG: formate dehydrogenase accessory sulfurtransferase FdhD, partial [Candidatus Altiarchaeota archaeon]